MRYLILCVVAGCALTSRSAPVEHRYFTPEGVTPTAAARPPRASCARLRLDRVDASDYLRFRIAHRRSPVELELFDTLRWTERPDQYARRALERALFDERGIPRATSDEDSPRTLDVEVTAFDAVERVGGSAGRVELRYELANDRDVVDAGTVAVERPAASTAIADVVRAIGAALEAASREVAQRVAARTCR